MPGSRIESAMTRPRRCVNIHFYQPAVGKSMPNVLGGTYPTRQALDSAREFVRSVE